MLVEFLLPFAAGGVVAGSATYALSLTRARRDLKNERQEAEKRLETERAHTDSIIAELKTHNKEERRKLDEDRQAFSQERRRVEEMERKASEREERMERRLEELEQTRQKLIKSEQELEKNKQSLEAQRSTLAGELSRIAELSPEEARQKLMAEAEHRYERDIVAVMEKKRVELGARSREMAKETLLGAMQQYASDVTCDTTQTVFPLESDDLKGKLIGREGRNITSFERATGVSLIIDDTPDTVFLSSFDLFRRYVAKRTLEDLIADKRIQPARIEEIAEKNQREAERLLVELGEKAIAELGLSGIPVEIVPLIGKFRFRSSYGQNILVHAKEVAYISEAIAKLIGADAALALKGGFLHDLGKAMDHDVEGTHPEIGGRIARKYGLDERIVNIIEGHHDDVPQICIETKIVQIADAISAVRPGARRVNVEQYVRRVQEMENIAMSFSGVCKAYALSAGREVRVFVDADTTTDLEAERMAQEIAQNIESTLTYPGEVKVNLIREKRVIEYAR